MRIKERLYVTGDRKRAVHEADRDGMFLLCKKGTELDNKVAEEYGIVDGYLVSPKTKGGATGPEPSVKVELEAKEKAENKDKDKENPIIQIVPPETKRSKDEKGLKINRLARK